jgi:hypothetical protein
MIDTVQQNEQISKDTAHGLMKTWMESFAVEWHTKWYLGEQG